MEENYVIPLKHRKIENLHVVFWLFKDLSWCFVWKPLGITMIFPTISIALVILYMSWSNMAERCHNLAISAWITANAYWMCTEFFNIDDKVAFGGIVYKQFTFIPFLVGVCSLSYFYVPKLIKIIIYRLR